MTGSDWLWLLALLTVVAVGLGMIGRVRWRDLRAHETQQWRRHHLEGFAAQLTQGGLSGVGLGTEVLGVFAGRRIRLSFAESPDEQLRVCLVLTVEPRGLTELCVSKASSQGWLGRLRPPSAEEDPPAEDPLGGKFRTAHAEREPLEGLFLSGHMEATLDQLFGPLGFAELTLRNSMLRVERPLDEADRLEWLAEAFHCLREVAWLCEGKEVVVRSLGDQPRLVWNPGTPQPLCPYCRDGVEPEGPEALAACSECSTVHHAACLAEAGGCTVFGCREGPPPGRQREL